MHVIKLTTTWIVIGLVIVVRVCGRSIDSDLLNVKGEASLEHAEDDSAARKLLQVFGLKEPTILARNSDHGRHGGRWRAPLPPEYMLELYNHTATEQGFMKTPNPYNANLIRSFTDKVRRRPKQQSGNSSKPFHVPTASALRFFFNVSAVSPTENLLQAEFHIYKLKPKTFKHRGLLEVRAYQIMPGASANSERGNKLLDVRRVSFDTVGWEVFYVRLAVADWVRDPGSNSGLFLTVRSISGKRLSDHQFRFARKQPHTSSSSPNGSDGGAVSKQPVLVVFSHDGRQAHAANVHFPGDSNEATPIPSPTPRSRRSLNVSPSYDLITDHGKSTTSAESLVEAVSRTPLRTSAPPTVADHSHGESTSCARYDLYVDFEKIGWSSWIISPKGYQAYHCKGACAFPLGQNQWPTNHATVQSIVNELHLTPGVGKPCCVPKELYPISLLYYDENENVILKQYDDMVAASCGCH